MDAHHVVNSHDIASYQTKTLPHQQYEIYQESNWQVLVDIMDILYFDSTIV